MTTTFNIKLFVGDFLRQTGEVVYSSRNTGSSFENIKAQQRMK